jgi:hypothetical protein
MNKRCIRREGLHYINVNEEWLWWKVHVYNYIEVRFNVGKVDEYGYIDKVDV